MSSSLYLKVSVSDAVWSLVVILVLTVFCKIVGLSLIIPFLFLYLGLHLFYLRKASIRLFLQLGLLLAIVLFGSFAFQRYTNISPLTWPVASIAMLVMLLFDDLHLSFVMSFLSSVLVSLTLISSPWLGANRLGFLPLDMTLIYFVGGLAGGLAIRNARTRGSLMVAGLYVGIIQSVAAVLAYHHENQLFYWPDFLRFYVKPLVISGISCAFVVISTSKIFEYLFGVITNFSLLELSDFNHPLLKRMILEAPGTYHHSLVVSNISEAAADAIGANALLTRVGAYYHDIGKLEKPDYFTENQVATGNKHDDLEPSMSRLVVLNHVKEGLELAQKYHLNPIIASFIPEHHGTSLMHYFYQKALAENPGSTEVKEENYRYPGPKPQRKETAIVLLADSAEAATRALTDPNPSRIEEVVRKVINNKFIDGQLDESDLTLRDIETIAMTFVRILNAMYHGRVKYPEVKHASEYRNPKPADEGPSPTSASQGDDT